MPATVTKSPTLAAELFGAGVGFRWYAALRRICTGLLVGTALLLLVRRLSGAFVRPPSFTTALVVIAAATVVAALYRLSLRRLTSRFELPPHVRDGKQLLTAFERPVEWEELLRCLLPPVALTAIACSLTLPEIGTPALAALWLTVVGGEAAWFGAKFAPRRNDSPPPVVVTAISEPSEVERVGRTSITEPEAAADEGVSQSWKRFRDADGAEVVEGFARAKFEAGSRQAVVHLSFCPPLERTPTLEAEPADDVDVALTTAVVLPYAARIDAKLPEPAEEELSLKIAIRVVAAATGECGPESGPARL